MFKLRVGHSSSNNQCHNSLLRFTEYVQLDLSMAFLGHIPRPLEHGATASLSTASMENGGRCYDKAC